MSKWVFPLHFIGFETSTVAIPLHKGRKPYEPLAFQHSHLVLHEDGKIEHKGQFIESITIKKSENGRKILRTGNRNMVDLEEILRKYTYFASTMGKTSMKVTFL